MSRHQGAEDRRGLDHLGRRPAIPAACRLAPLDDGPVTEKNRLPAVTLVEVPDPDGRRWQAVLELLLEAGRALTTETDVPQ
jgi:hypothetical protein